MLHKLIIKKIMEKVSDEIENPVEKFKMNFNRK